jgi:hypothetical protein
VTKWPVTKLPVTNWPAVPCGDCNLILHSCVVHAHKGLSPSDNVTKWPSDQVTKWPSDQVTKWPSDQVTKWPSDQVTSEKDVEQYRGYNFKWKIL